MHEAMLFADLIISHSDELSILRGEVIKNFKKKISKLIQKQIDNEVVKESSDSEDEVAKLKKELQVFKELKAQQKEYERQKSLLKPTLSAVLVKDFEKTSAIRKLIDKCYKKALKKHQMQMKKQGEPKLLGTVFKNGFQYDTHFESNDYHIVQNRFSHHKFYDSTQAYNL